jgi:hypothetical protein
MVLERTIRPEVVVLAFHFGIVGTSHSGATIARLMGRIQG